MKRIGELAVPVFIKGVDSLDAASKHVLKDLTLEERKQFYEDVKRDMLNPNYRLAAYQSYLILCFKLTLNVQMANNCPKRRGCHTKRGD
jgi:hypothetical protein